MNVKDLREAIKDLPDDMTVILQKDGEGNGYSPLDSIDDTSIYVPESTWAGTVYDESWSADDCCLEEKEWKELKKGARCLVLVPVN